MHGPRHSTEEFKVFNKYSKKYAAQRPQKDKEARSGSNKKCTNTNKLDSQTQEVKFVESHDATISRKKKGKNQAKKS